MLRWLWRLWNTYPQAVIIHQGRASVRYFAWTQAPGFVGTVGMTNWDLMLKEGGETNSDGWTWVPHSGFSRRDLAEFREWAGRRDVTRTDSPKP